MGQLDVRLLDIQCSILPEIRLCPTIICFKRLTTVIKLAMIVVVEEEEEEVVVVVALVVVIII